VYETFRALKTPIVAWFRAHITYLSIGYVGEDSGESGVTNNVVNFLRQKRPAIVLANAFLVKLVTAVVALWCFNGGGGSSGSNNYTLQHVAPLITLLLRIEIVILSIKILIAACCRRVWLTSDITNNLQCFTLALSKAQKLTCNTVLQKSSRGSAASQRRAKSSVKIDAIVCE
jgi:hypothetical protein